MRYNPGRSRGESLGLLAAATVGVVGLTFLYQQQTRNSVPHRPGDSAPGRTARQTRFGRYAVVGRAITIAKPRAEVFAFWRDFANLPRFMQNVRHVEQDGELTRWTIAGPMGHDVHLETRIVADRPESEIAWRSTENSEIDTEGKILFCDAPGERGTEIEAIVAYVPPMGELGRWVAKAFQAEPHLQGRRELKRLKMLMETGEIATSANRKTPA
ncbi:SRPBCC family protein [Citreimonas sp.]|uniref:SRPBCC family protein n=1 Tax=Citreimonas sp. TaxID=3036715 RepID=UPI0035C7C016